MLLGVVTDSSACACCSAVAEDEPRHLSTPPHPLIKSVYLDFADLH